MHPLHTPLGTGARHVCAKLRGLTKERAWIPEGQNISDGTPEPARTRYQVPVTHFLPETQGDRARYICTTTEVALVAGKAHPRLTTQEVLLVQELTFR